MNDNIKEQFLDLILEALDLQILKQVEGDPINKGNYLDVDFFAFSLNNKQYNVTFKNKYKLIGKRIEVVRRGSNFIKDLLRHIFHNYNLLFINNIKTDFSVKNVKAPATIHGLVLQVKEIIGDAPYNNKDDYQYQVNFLIDIRDTITGLTNNKKIISGLGVKYKEGQIPQYYPCKEVEATEEEGEESEQLFQTETLAKLKELTEKLKQPEEKIRILEEVRHNKHSDLHKYLIERDAVADKYNVEEINFDFNVAPISMYAIKSDMKIIRFKVTYGSIIGTAELYYSHNGEIKYRCPNCLQPLTARFVYAKSSNKGDYFLACEDCAMKLDKYNSVYEDDGWYSKDQVGKTLCLHAGEEQELLLLKEDIGFCEFDKVNYYKNDLAKFDKILQDGVWLNNDSNLTVHKKYVEVCNNCDMILISNNKEGFYHSDDKENVACCFCVNKPREGNIKKEYFLSDYSGTCFALAEADICGCCGKMIGGIERITCKGCGEVVCPSCQKDDICLHCDSVLNSDLIIGKFTGLWKHIKNNIIIPERRKKKMRIDVHKHLFSDCKELRVLYKGNRPVIYYFHDIEGKYIYKGRRKL